MIAPSSRTRIYPAHVKTTYLVFGLMLTIAVFFTAALFAYSYRFIFTTLETQRHPLPGILWVSTALLLAGSHFLFRACRAVRRERQAKFRKLLVLSCFAATSFCVLQSFAMLQLLDFYQVDDLDQRASMATVAVLIFLHATHFLFGLGALLNVTYAAHQGRYDHEYYLGVRLTAIYWRFLDVVWLIMLLLFVIASG